MVGGGCMMNDFDDNTMIYGDVFDKIEDLLDFSSEEMQMLLEPEPLSFDDGHAADSGFPPVINTTAVAAGAGAGASSATAGIKSDDDTFPCEDIDVAQLEWLSNFVEESFSPTSIELPKSNNIVNHNSNSSSNNNNSNSNSGVEAINDTNKVELHYRTPSPVSVLEHNGPMIGGGSGGSFSSSSSSPTSSSCSSVGNGVMVLASFNPPETVVARGRAPRTKRPRPPSGPRSNILMPFVPSSVEDTSDDSLLMIPSMNMELENFAESNPTTAELQAYQAPIVNRKKKLKIVSSASIAREVENSQLTSATPVRKCMHCEIQKTPQWRAGPMGPKTLCNACGVRYKSGRLFPEYRPAASPTFLASRHSNSHKKVVEMRVKATTKEVPVAAASLPVSAKGCELLNYIREAIEN